MFYPVFNFKANNLSEILAKMDDIETPGERWAFCKVPTGGNAVNVHIKPQ